MVATILGLPSHQWFTIASDRCALHQFARRLRLNKLFYSLHLVVGSQCPRLLRMTLRVLVVLLHPADGGSCPRPLCSQTAVVALVVLAQCLRQLYPQTAEGTLIAPSWVPLSHPRLQLSVARTRHETTTALWLSPRRSMFGCSLSSVTSDVPERFSTPLSLAHTCSSRFHAEFSHCSIESLLERQSQHSGLTRNCLFGFLDDSNSPMSATFSLPARVKTPSACSSSCLMVTSVFSPVQSCAHELRHVSCCVCVR